MSEFSTEMAAERIVDSRTRRYFREVLGCYNAGYFRSAIVTLWSVVVCDLLFKLDQLANAHGDSIAEKILKEIDVKRKSNPKSPEWETELLKLIADKTHMLEVADLRNLEFLQSHRHLSAHPILTATDALFTPNRETARAHIRNAIEAVLAKPAIMSKRVFDAFIEDLEANSKVLSNEESVKRYLESKYFPHFTAQVEEKIFRNLWRLVFRTTDPRCEKNRIVNYYALIAFFNRRATEMTRLIETDAAHFSDCHFDGTACKALTAFLRLHPQVYPCLTEAARTLLQNYASLDFEVFATAWYLSESIEEHGNAVLSRVRDDASVKMTKKTFEHFCSVLREEKLLQQAKDVAIALYSASGSYNTADQRFDRLIRPLLADFTKDDMVMFLRQSEGNRQTSDRGTSDYLEVKTQIDALFGPDFDIAPYPGFSRALHLASD